MAKSIKHQMDAHKTSQQILGGAGGAAGAGRIGSASAGAPGSLSALLAADAKKKAAEAGAKKPGSALNTGKIHGSAGPHGGSAAKGGSAGSNKRGMR